MPTYDYKCDSCEHEFELFQQMSANPIRKCPDCGQRKVRRLIGMGAGVIFKGSGFYETDYKRKKSGGQGDAKAAAEKTSADTPAKTEAKTDTKKAATAE
jgi:putative FmdB family regulatory protein